MNRRVLLSTTFHLSLLPLYLTFHALRQMTRISLAMLCEVEVISGYNVIINSTSFSSRPALPSLSTLTSHPYLLSPSYTLSLSLFALSSLLLLSLLYLFGAPDAR